MNKSITYNILVDMSIQNIGCSHKNVDVIVNIIIKDNNIVSLLANIIFIVHLYW